MANIIMPIAQLTKDLTINITIAGYKRWLIRLHIAMLLFRLGGWIAGVDVVVNKPEPNCPASIRPGHHLHLVSHQGGNLYRCSCGCVFEWADEFHWVVKEGGLQ